MCESWDGIVFDDTILCCFIEQREAPVGMQFQVKIPTPVVDRRPQPLRKVTNEQFNGILQIRFDKDTQYPKF